MKFLVILFAIGHAVWAQFQLPNPGFKLPFQPTQAPSVPFDSFVNQGQQTLPRMLAQYFNPVGSGFNLSSLPVALNPSALNQIKSIFGNYSEAALIRKSVENAIKQLNETANKTSVQGLQRIENAFENINVAASSIANKARNVTTSSIRDIETRISQYNQTVQSCIRGNTKYGEIISAARDEAVECVRNKKNEGFLIVNQTRINIVEVVLGVQNVSSSVQKCSSLDHQNQFNLGVVGCFVSAILNIRSSTILLPLEMTKRYSEMDTAVSTIRADIIKCAMIITETAAEQSLNATKTIASCLMKK